jgi:hypothetical protein
MRVCVVGSGPTAEGKGDEIDACDFVVRLKAFWLQSAADAGERIDAWATYGHVRYPSELTQPRETWITQPLSRYAAHTDGEARCATLANDMMGQRVRWLRGAQWREIEHYTGLHPSTGLVAIHMALCELRPTWLLLYGFDATTPDRPNFVHARVEPGVPGPEVKHDFLREKQTIARLGAAEWLGKPCNVRLAWPDMPRHVTPRSVQLRRKIEEGGGEVP